MEQGIFLPLASHKDTYNILPVFAKLTSIEWWVGDVTHADSSHIHTPFRCVFLRIILVFESFCTCCRNYSVGSTLTPCPACLWLGLNYCMFVRVNVCSWKWSQSVPSCTCRTWQSCWRAAQFWGFCRCSRGLWGVPDPETHSKEMQMLLD